MRPPELGKGDHTAGIGLQRRVWHWAPANRAPHGSLPSGSAIGAAHGRQERRGRLEKKVGQTGALALGGPETKHTQG